MAGALVKLRSGATVVTSADGGFVMDSVAAGLTTLAAVAAGCRIVFATVDVPERGAVAAELRVPDTIRGPSGQGSSLPSLSREQLRRRGYRSVYDAVRALAPYMVNEESGQVGGARSLSNGSNRTFFSNVPIIILDGVRLTNSSIAALDDFKVEDLERIQIARGPSEAWTYGIGAANGAIILTSRRAAAAAELALEDCEVIFPSADGP